MQTIAEILNSIKSNSMNVLEIARQTGIPATRIYKWLDGKGKPKAEDSEEIRKWASSHLAEIPHHGKQKPLPTAKDDAGAALGQKGSLSPGKRVITMDDYIRLLETQNEKLTSILEANLTAIQANLTGLTLAMSHNQQMLRGVANTSLAYNETILKVLARQDKLADDETYVEEADKRQCDFEGQAENMDSNTAAHR